MIIVVVFSLLYLLSYCLLTAAAVTGSVEVDPSFIIRKCLAALAPATPHPPQTSCISGQLAPGRETKEKLYFEGPSGRLSSQVLLFFLLSSFFSSFFGYQAFSPVLLSNFQHFALLNDLLTAPFAAAVKFFLKLYSAASWQNPFQLTNMVK